MPIWFCFLGKSWPKHEYVFVERKACVRFDRDLPKIGQASKCKSVRITRTAAMIIIVIDVKWLHRFSVLWACARYLEQGGHLHILKLLFASFNLIRYLFASFNHIVNYLISFQSCPLKLLLAQQRKIGQILIYCSKLLTENCLVLTFS